MQALRRIVIAVTLAFCTAPAFAADPGGTWLTEDGEAKVQISDCRQAYCGTIVWLKEPNDPQTGKPKLDKFNQHESMRSRRVLGMQIIYGMHPSGANSWKGSLYNPEDGNTFSGSLALQGGDRLKLEGCVLALFCRSEVWRRVH